MLSANATFTPYTAVGSNVAFPSMADAGREQIGQLTVGHSCTQLHAVDAPISA